MNLSDPIGGYLELEAGRLEYEPRGAVLLNSARNCLEYIMRAYDFEKIYIPKYTCDVLLEPLQRLGVPYEFYTLNGDLEIAHMPSLENRKTALLYTNYFGIKDAYSRKLAEKFGEQLIIDCSQAFYFEAPFSVPVFFSPRKFFGVPDGGILYADKRIDEAMDMDTSLARMNYLLERVELGPEAGYTDFKAADVSLRNSPMKHMSKLTQRLLGAADVAGAKERRKQNFRLLQSGLGKSNKLKIGNADAAALCYPYMTSKGGELRDRLIRNKIFVPTFWPNVLEWCAPEELEYRLATELLPLPIDQRYDAGHMQRILELIHES
jgi:hypothetical protein